MPIRPEHRFFYPIDWPQLSDAIRFRRARGRCEECTRPHLQRVFHLGDGRWWDTEISGWRDGQGRRLRQQWKEIHLALGRSQAPPQPQLRATLCSGSKGSLPRMRRKVGRL